MWVGTGRSQLCRVLWASAVLVAFAGVCSRQPSSIAKVDVGQIAPKFTGLMGTDGISHSLDDYKSAKVIVIAFTCNHCPVAANVRRALCPFRDHE